MSASAPEGFCPVCELRGALDCDPVTELLSPEEAARLASAPADSAESALKSIRFLGDYELLEEIAHGGMGVVFRARQISLNRVVAIKMIIGGHLVRPSFIQRFKTEAEAAAKLHHPNIVPIYEVGEHEGQHYFSMRLIEGGSLADNLSRGSRREQAQDQAKSPKAESRHQSEPRHVSSYTLRAVASLVAKVARAVHHAHQHGILHRDLKPGNILIDERGEPYVTDFGLAKIVDQESSLTLSQAVLGTASYMPPEQAGGGGKQLTTAVDVYSLGAVLYELLSGQPPFRGETPLETMRKVIEEEPLPPNQAVLSPGDPASGKPKIRNPKSEIDQDLETICLRCLEKEPLRRYGSAEALAEELERWLRHEPILARPTSAVTRVRKWVRRRPAVAGLVVALNVVFAFGLAGVLWQSHRAKAQAERASASERKAIQNLYVSDINLAQQALEANNLMRTAALLERHRPEPDKPDLRGFEWRYLWQRFQGDEEMTLGGHPARVYQVSFSPEGKLLAAATGDEVHVWDLPTRGRVRILKHPDHVTGVAFSPNGRSLASCGDDGLRVWNTADWSEQAQWLTHLGFLPVVAFSPDGKTLGVGNNPVKLWDVETRQSLALEGSGGPFAFSPDGKMVATVEMDGPQPIDRMSRGIQLWDLESKKKLRRLEGASDFLKQFTPSPYRGTLAFSNDGRSLALGSYQGAILLCDTESGHEATILSGHSGLLQSIIFLPAEKALASTGYDQTIRIWDLETKKARSVLRGHRGSIHSLALSPERGVLASGSIDRTVKFWNLKRIAAVDEPRLVSQPVSLSSDGNALRAFERSSLELQFLSLTNSRVVDHLDFSTDGIREFGSSPDGEKLVTVSSNGVAQVWSMAFRKSLATLQETGEPIIAAEFSRDGQRLITRSSKETVSLWALALAKRLASIRMEAPEEVKFLFGDTFLTEKRISLETVALTLWDAVSGKTVASLNNIDMQAGAAVRSAAFSADSRYVALGLWDGELILWDLTSALPLTVVQAHHDRVGSLVFSPDGRTLVTGSGSGPMKLWNVATGQEMGTLQGHKTAVNWLAFSQDGRALASWSSDQELRLWRAPSFAEIEIVRNKINASP